MIRKLSILFSVLLCAVLFVADAHAQYGGFGGYGGGYGGGGYGGGGYGGYGGGISGNRGNAYSYNDPRLGYCLENDCYGANNQGGNCIACQQAPRSRFVVERGGRRVLTYVGTYEGFVQRYPQYASKVARPVIANTPATSGRSTVQPRENQPGYDSFGNPLPREIPAMVPKARTGNGSKANVPESTETSTDEVDT